MHDQEEGQTPAGVTMPESTCKTFDEVASGYVYDGIRPLEKLSKVQRHRDKRVQEIQDIVAIFSIVNTDIRLTRNHAVAEKLLASTTAQREVNSFSPIARSWRFITTV